MKKKSIILFVCALTFVSFFGYELEAKGMKYFQLGSHRNPPFKYAEISPDAALKDFGSRRPEMRHESDLQDAHLPVRQVDDPITAVDNSKLSKVKSANSASLIRGHGPLAALARANPDAVFVHGLKKEKTVALTFDDGPDNINTPKLLDILGKEGINASFFMIGKKIDNCTEVVKRADREGNLILNHSYTHPELRKLKFEDVQHELVDTDNKIYSVINKHPAFVRPPFGAADQKTVDEITKLHYKTVFWSLDTLDWLSRDKTKIINSIIPNVKNGDIILLHMDEDKQATLEAVPVIIEKLKTMGYKFETLDKLLGIQAYR